MGSAYNQQAPCKLLDTYPQMVEEEASWHKLDSQLTATALVGGSWVIRLHMTDPFRLL